MKVGVIAPAFPPHVGGIESFVETVVLGLCAHGAVPFILTADPPAAEVFAAVERVGGRVVYGQQRPPPGSVAWEYEAFARAERVLELVRAHDLDVVHVFSHDTALAAAIARGASPRPKVVASFGEMATESSDFGRQRSDFIYGLPQIDAIVAGSQFYANVARGHGFEDSKISVVLSGIDVERFRSGSRQRGRQLVGVADDALMVVCPSRFSPRKGQLDLVHAVAKLEPLYARLRVVLTGSIHSGSAVYLDEVRQAVDRASLSSVVSIHLQVPRDAMPDLLAAADLVVQPSHREGLGTAAIEAMAAGTCTLLTQVTGFDEIAEHDVTAYFVPPADPSALGVGLMTLLEDEERRRALAARAQDHVRREFSDTAMIARFLFLYEALITGG